MALVGFSFVAVMMMATLVSAEDAKQAPAKTTEKASAPAKEDTKAKQDDATIIAQQKASYPLDTCVIRDSKLGEMGEPVDYVYKGRLVRFCCKGCIKAFEKDPETKAVVINGEIGGSGEEEAAEYISKHMTKPVVAFIGGQSAPKGKRMGHAGAIIMGGKGTAEGKMDALRKAGVAIAMTPDTIGETLVKTLSERGIVL